MHARLTVADVVEGIRFVDTAAPDPDHVLVAVHEKLQPLSVLFSG